jgi:parallel beta-helix repeat protein
MPLTITDFVEQEDGLTIEDVPPEVRERINGALGDLTGGGEGPPENPDAILVSKNLNGRDGYEEIQAAVDNASDGDTIFVEAGVYEEQVVVDRDLTITGWPGATIAAPGQQDRETFTIPETGRDLDPIVFAFGGNRDGQNNVSGPGTTALELTGFTIDGQDRPFNGTYQGLLLRNVNGLVEDNVVENMTTGNGVSGGISIRGDSTLAVRDNEVSGYERIGIVANGDYGSQPDPDVVIENNDVRGPGTPVSNWAPNGIQVGAGATADITGNTVTGHQYDGSTNPGGILAFASTNVRIENNDVSGNDDGVQVFGDFFFGSGLDASNTVVKGNTIENNEVGIVVASKAVDTTIENNTIGNNTLGLSVGIFDDDVVNLVLKNNDIPDNDGGVVITVGGTGTLDGWTIDSNDFEDVSGFYVSDADDQVNLTTVLNNNTFSPSAAIQTNEIVPGGSGSSQARRSGADGLQSQSGSTIDLSPWP